MQRLQAELLYDSAQADDRIGLRSTMRLVRTLVYQAGDVSVDVMAHTAPGGLRFFHGQVVRDSATPVPHASVRLGAGTDVVATDEHGQFALSAPILQGCQLLRVASGGHEVVCSIPAHDDRRTDSGK